MTTLLIQWRPKTGEPKQLQLPAASGKAFPASAVGLAGEAPLARPVEGGWEITVPAGTVGKAGKGGTQQDLAALVASGQARQASGSLVIRLGSQLDQAVFALPGGDLALRIVAGAGAGASPPAAARPAAPAQPAAPAMPPPGGRPAPAVPAFEPVVPRSRAFAPILGVMLLLHVLLMIWLGTADVPEQMFTDPSQIPERFAKLIVPKKEEPKEEAGGKGQEAAPVQEAPKEKPSDEGDAGDKGGDKQKEAAAPRSKEQVREAVRSKGILAILGAKKSGGGALSDVLGEGGLAGSLDQALSDVGGVVVAQRGMDVRSARGSGGGKAAGIGDLEAGAGRGMGLGSKAERKVAASVDTAAFETSGSLSGDAIRQVIQRQLRQVQYCYEKELSTKPDLAGKVVVRITIGEDGAVAKFEIESTTLNDQAVESCILQRVRRWKFPAPDSGTVSVSLPFVFTSAS